MNFIFQEKTRFAESFNFLSLGFLLNFNKKMKWDWFLFEKNNKYSKNFTKIVFYFTKISTVKNLLKYVYSNQF